MQPLTDAKSIAYNRDTRDFDATFDGQYIGSFPNYSAAENALNDHAMRLIEDGLVDAPLALLEQVAACDPPTGDPSEPGPGPDSCANCGGTHHIQRCPEILTALFAPRRTLVLAVRTTAREWLTEDWQRDAAAREWSKQLKEVMPGPGIG